MSISNHQTDTQILQLNVKSSFLDRDRQLVITDEYVEFDDKDSIAAKQMRFDSSHIIAFRYGIKWIKGY
jgi:hypothetical protein